MPNPYGMTEVDIPGILAQFEQRKDRRLQQLLTQRQIQQADRELENENKTAAAWGKFLGPQGGVGGAAGAYGQQGGQTAPAPSPQPQAAQAPDYDPWSDEDAQNELVRSLAAVAPEDAMKIREAFQNHSAEEREQAAENWKMIGSAAFQLRQLPPQERTAELQRMTPMLQSLGIDEQMIAQVDLSDRGLESIVDQSRDIEQVIAGRTPRAVPVQAGGSVHPFTPGQPYPDFGGEGGAQEGATATNPQTGEQVAFRGGRWEPVVSNDEGGRILQSALQRGTITRAEASRALGAFGPNGQREFDAWLRTNNVRVVD